MSNNATEQSADFESVKNRLAEIADAVDDESLSLDEALDLYEEAVALGLQASDLLEAGIVPPAEDESAEGDAAAVDAVEGEASTNESADVSASAEPANDQA